MLDAPSAASALLFAGVTSVALSPAVVLLATVVLHHNDLILLAIGSAFVWLLAITVCASFWWATASLGDGSRLVLAPPRVLASRLAARCRVATAVRWPQSREDYAATYDVAAGVEIDRRFGTSRRNFEMLELGHIDVDSADSWTTRPGLQIIS